MAAAWGRCRAGWQVGWVGWWACRHEGQTWISQEGCSCQWSEQASELTGQRKDWYTECVCGCVSVRGIAGRLANWSRGAAWAVWPVATQARTCWLGLPQLGRVGFGLVGFGGEIFRVEWWNGKAIVAGLPGLVWAVWFSGCCGTAD